MFILYSVLIGLALGLILGGRPAGLAAIQFRFAWLIGLGFAIQMLLFSTPLTERVGAFGAPLYVLSTGLVFVGLLANLRIRGLQIVTIGAACNLIAIVANGGYMPASPAALAAAGMLPKSGYSNSTVVADPALAGLTDIYALPPWLPFANVYSIGDILISVGIIVVFVVAMRDRTSDQQLDGSLSPT
jgi:hypothetical protein